jgi:hypothetical protein
MGEKAAENPELYDPDAQKRMDEEIARIQEVLRSARSQLKKWTVQQMSKPPKFNGDFTPFLESN